MRKSKLLLFDKQKQEFITIPYVNTELLINLLVACRGIPASHKYHNRGVDGLFIHLVQVAYDVSHTLGFEELNEQEQQLLVYMALLHDAETKIPQSLMKYHVLEELGYLIDEYFDGVPAMCDVVYNYIMYHHHGFVDGAATFSTLYQAFTDDVRTVFIRQGHFEKLMRIHSLVFEVARCDAYDAALSYGQEGNSRLKVFYIVGSK